MKSLSFWLAVVVVLTFCVVAWVVRARTTVIQAEVIRSPLPPGQLTPGQLPPGQLPPGQLPSGHAAKSVAEPKLFPVTIKRPVSAPLAHGVDPHSGSPVTVACATCHATRTPNLANQATADLDLFHQGLQVQHGANTCLSCHNPQDYGSLHLANGTRVECTDVVTLCSQCHGPQYRDFQHGAHGGMNGYWDLTKGPRERNGCTSCHDPHAPRFRGAHPVLPPRDRFLEPTHE